MVGTTIAKSWYRRHCGPATRRSAAHFALQAWRYLNTTFPNRWIGRGFADDQAPFFAWPPRSPDFTTPDNALWGFIKDEITATTQQHNYEQLWKMPSTK
ncbi:hypothetical protein ANN_20516 [Periplaneta americana]|uniref:Uncharacterized protein n=1 Tax=Periplaneta americana TaxID=6978 RepID=A0ABQ8SE03_PERAM|nr:hypothetical protein ANN_20516 [Periplaneta americana]